MNARPPIIVGAGLAGLLAAHAWPQCDIVEVSPEPVESHRAVLRFRTESVSKLTGIEFRKVRVRKGIWSLSGFREPSIRLANAYSLKCLGKLVADRSIWSIEAADRYVAPDTFYDQLLDNVSGRVTWGTAMDWSAACAKISTAPMPITLAALGLPLASQVVSFDRSPIVVARARIPRCDVFQTVYYPDGDTPMYRTSITGDSLIIEAVPGTASPEEWMPWALQTVARSFGINADSITPTYSTQRYGKIAPIDDSVRKRAMFDLTHKHEVYSLGRFATWRNILLDDVVDDIAVIKRLLRSSSYDLLHAAQR